MISSIMGNGSTFRVAVEQKSHLWLLGSSLYRECSWSASPGGRASSSLPARLLHLWPSGYGTAELGLKILLWACLHVVLSCQSPPYPVMIVHSGFVECKPGFPFTDLKDQASI